MTVVWLRPPNARPIAGSVWSVSSRARYMATWRGQVTGAARLVESSSLDRDAERLAGPLLDVLRPSGAAGASAGIEAGEDLVGEVGGDGRPVSEPKATTRISAPSSARMFVVDALGDQVERAGVDAVDAVLLHALAQDRAGAWRASGGRTSVTRPASKRSRRRSSSASRSRGRRSEVRTSWAPAPCSALKVWKNSCSVRALLCEELDVVDEQDVDAAVGGLEGLDRAGVERADEAGR